SFSGSLPPLQDAKLNATSAAAMIAKNFFIIPKFVNCYFVNLIDFSSKYTQISRKSTAFF
ncbi:MAG: hypothetical protein IIU10_04255, partial [Paludibacteraceae bacterium]|nr:hypothetical protein [Paludibacteraceae bacterium]